MKVLKFGGSSVANAVNIKKVIKIITGSLAKSDNVIVVSALGGVTDQLIRLASLAAAKNNQYQKLLTDLIDQHNQVITALIQPNRHPALFREVKNKYDELYNSLFGIYLLGERSLRSLDQVMSFGEQLSAYLISAALCDQGVDCQFIDARTVIRTDANFGSAKVNFPVTSQLLVHHFQVNPGLAILGGFIAANDEGITTTLGRGGSDYTAAIVGAALDATAIEIWTDVDGVMTADPRQVAEAFPLPDISYEEAGELAHFGAKVIHPKTMQPARLKNIPIDIKNTFNPSVKGTRISSGQTQSAYLITGISSLSGVALLCLKFDNGKNIGEVTARVFDVLARSGIEILLITAASYEPALSFAVPSNQAQLAAQVIEQAWRLEIQAGHLAPITIEDKLSIVAIVGQQMKGVPGISGQLLSTLGNNQINVVAIAQGSSELNVSTVISSIDEKKAVQIIHEAFFRTPARTINLFLIGTGLIGSTLLQQISASAVAIRLCGLANSRRMWLDKQGIALPNWQANLDHSQPLELNDFIAHLVAFNLPNSVVVDCTASVVVAARYEELLAAGVSVVTPNKKANASSQAQYDRLQALKNTGAAQFVYDTNVGAGLPVISTLQNLVRTGDKVISIEGVFSGTMSYLFNEFMKSDLPFSALVRQAKEQGYTEPDPRDDLRGADVGRKALILARESGWKLEPEGVRVAGVMNEAVERAVSLEGLWPALASMDAGLLDQKNQAKECGLVLRYLARVADGCVTVGLTEVGPEHPAYHLSGAENIFIITTERYRTMPLVIKGPGAGAEVTAAGVLSDVIRLVK